MDTEGNSRLSGVHIPEEIPTGGEETSLITEQTTNEAEDNFTIIVNNDIDSSLKVRYL